MENKGGAELQCYYLAQELITRGWEVHYIREYRDEYPNENYRVENIIIHGIKKRRNELRWLNTNQLYQLMNSIKADCYYCRASISYVHSVVKNAKKIGGSTVIWACSHDNELKNQTKGRFITQILGKLNNMLFNKALLKIDHIFLQTDYQQKLLKEQFKLSGTVIHNGHPKPKLHKKEGKKNIIVWVGRLQTWKHPEKFVGIAEKLLNCPYQFIAIGKPLINNNLAAAMLAADKKLSNFEYKGELSNSDVCSIIAQAKLLVNTSDYEGFSNTFIEAWARGVPVVSLKVDPDNVLQNRKIGLRSNSYEQLIEDVDFLMKDDKAWAELSNNCIHFFNTSLTINRCVDKLEAKILSSSG